MPSSAASPRRKSGGRAAGMRAIAGWPQDGKGYFLPRAQEVPEEALYSRIWPEADRWHKRMEAYHPDRDDNEVVRLDLAGTGFLRLLRALRVVLLQDSVILRKQFPLHPLWKDSLFNCPEYLRFAARVESSLADVVTPAELTMQKYWPAQEAVAKLRYEGVISEVRGVRSQIAEVSERLGQMERSVAAFAPIWIQQGCTGIWIWPTGVAHPPPHQPHQPLPPLPPPTSSPPQHPDGPNLEAGITPARVSYEYPALPCPARLALTTPAVAAAAATFAPTSAPTSAPASAPASTPASSSTVPAAAPASAPALQGPFVLDPQAPPRQYKMLRGSDSVFQLWIEWTLGLMGGPSIEALDRCWGARWRVSCGEPMFYSRRSKVIAEIRRRVGDGTARDERHAIDQLEQLRGSRSLDWLCKNIDELDRR